MIKIYGLRNCDTVKKALKWADEQKLDYQFHDFKKSPVSEETVTNWLQAVGAEILVNKRGTTFRKLDDKGREILEGENAAPLLVEQPTLMKRPIFDLGGQYVIGFKDKEKEAVLLSA